MTQLWPLGPARRAIHFAMKCKLLLPTVFEDYEASGGEYYGPDKDDTESSDSSSNDEQEEVDGDKLILSQVDDVF